MHASLTAVRIAPKKAAILAKMICGKSVPDAVHLLEHVNKKAARIMEQLLRSAMANASHNEKQDPQMMIVKTVVVNKASVLHRGVPMARGRVRPIKKFSSHIEMTLGFKDEIGSKQGKKSEKSEKDASQTAKKPVKKASTTSSKGKSAKDSASPTSLSSKSSKKSS